MHCVRILNKATKLVRWDPLEPWGDFQGGGWEGRVVRAAVNRLRGEHYSDPRTEEIYRQALEDTSRHAVCRLL